MQIDWRGLLDRIGTPWRDKGANTTKGNVNIKCPWCIADPSAHLSIAEAHEAYYCYREPNRHSGTNFVRLLVKLGQAYVEAPRLLNEFRRAGLARGGTTTGITLAQVPNNWDRFGPVSQLGNRGFNYLLERGFAAPRALCEKYDLRMASAGPWANRLLIPYRRNGKVITWTGRAIGPAELRYYTQSVSNAEGLFYVPDETRAARSLVIVEGPLDALKVVSGIGRAPWQVAALAGKHLSSGKLLHLRELAKNCDSVILALDQDAPIGYSYHLMAELAGAIKDRPIRRARLPLGHKDPAEIPTEMILPWLDAQPSTRR